MWVREWEAPGFGEDGSIVHWNGKGGEGDKVLGQDQKFSSVHGTGKHVPEKLAGK